MTRLPLLLVLALATACGGEADRPATRPTAPERAEAELALERSATGNPPRRDLIVVGLDGNPRREFSGSAGGVSWSPDGEQLAFTKERGDGRERRDIFLVRADGSALRQLTRTGEAGAPVWSPDGETIAYAQFEPAARGLPAVSAWSVGVDGGDPRLLLQARAGEYIVPSGFTPDGDQLALTRLRLAESGGSARYEQSVLLLELESLETSTLVDDGAEAVFSPDGRRIAYVTGRDRNGTSSYGDVFSYANELYVMDADGADARRLTITRDLNEANPSWSPDGNVIAYERGEVVGNAEGTIVMTIHADGRCPRRIAHDPGLGVWYRAPAWRPGTLRTDHHLRCPPHAPVRLAPLGGNLSLEEAARFRPFRLLWPGRRFDGLVLSAISGDPRGHGHVGLFYGKDLQIQLFPVSLRTPAIIDLVPDGCVSIRGVQGVFFEEGNRLELVTGKTTVVIFARRELALRVARALRSFDGAISARDRLPLPTPPTLGRARCP